VNDRRRSLFRDAEAHGKLDRILAALAALTTHGDETMAAIDDLIAQVKANTDVEASAAQALAGVLAQLSAANTANDPKIAQVIATLKASVSPLASAVAAVPA
jgi:ABC-type transporter Mla subunit MlaD